MKGGIIYIVLAIAIISAAFSYTQRSTDTNNPIDKLAKGLNGLETVLPVQTNISIRLYNLDNTPYLLSRYLLAPRYISFSGNEAFDTTLSLCSLNTTDSTINTITTNKKILWQHTDEQYRYFLTCNN